ncbi:phosphate/phosphite/phosphonate ABC transporter substrate-binding protein [Polynucleobacter sp. MWH-UH25E]|uniref:phosphate/phosphite/phosphonate ABC transporter substrate-binding protein n=1 Tax=Polynucleobacter sp. MWH-UH25E TaxID=1855616 RepID=UPI001BFE98FA|nr:phosphate/phosphite/phosphonate ABC transporter substrate-binding protein [Polynucleobacter sp. MWH-UH25E]QWD61812.1 phosphate/phosphite/phosphonate ABC transporter substrate-binding protein [Polynucleobacter sp. MWH-UH25E]
MLISLKTIGLNVLTYATLLFGVSVAIEVHAACIGDQSAVVVRSVYVVPQLAPTQLYATWAPVLERVGKSAKACFDLQIPVSINAFEKAVMSGKADFAFMNPYHLVMAHRAQGYDPLLADGKQLLDGIIVVKADSPITSIAELKNQKVAFPSPNAFGASLLMRSLFSKAHVPITPVYVRSHGNVYRAVILGDAAAGGGVNATFLRERLEVRERLRILYVSPGFRPHPFAVHPRVPQGINVAVMEGFMNLKRDPSSEALLEGIQMPDPIAVSYKQDYQALENLDLDKFVVNDAN